jgi:hypothetical protein
MTTTNAVGAVSLAFAAPTAGTASGCIRYEVPALHLETSGVDESQTTVCSERKLGLYAPREVPVPGVMVREIHADLDLTARADREGKERLARFAAQRRLTCEGPEDGLYRRDEGREIRFRHRDLLRGSKRSDSQRQVNPAPIPTARLVLPEGNQNLLRCTDAKLESGHVSQGAGGWVASHRSYRAASLPCARRRQLTMPGDPRAHIGCCGFASVPGVSRPPRDFRGLAAVQPVDPGRPLRGRMPQQRGAVVLQIRRELDAQRVLDLRWLQQR